MVPSEAVHFREMTQKIHSSPQECDNRHVKPDTRPFLSFSTSLGKCQRSLMVSMRLLAAKCHIVKHSVSRDCFSLSVAVSHEAKQREMNVQITFFHLKAEKLRVLTPDSSVSFSSVRPS